MKKPKIPLEKIKSNQQRLINPENINLVEEDKKLKCSRCDNTHVDCTCVAIAIDGMDDIYVPEASLTFDFSTFMETLDKQCAQARAYNPDTDPPMYVEIAGYSFLVELWSPGMPVLHDDTIAVDTETHMLESGAPIKPVTIQACSKREMKVQVAQHPHLFEYWTQLYNENPDTEWIFHNAPFDCDVLGLYKQRPLLKWLINTPTSRGTRRIVDTSIRYVMHALRKGNYYGGSRLSIASKMLLGEEIDKDKIIRHTFHQNMVLCHDHLLYAAKDAVITLLIRQVMNQEYPTEHNTTRAYFALRDISTTGMLPDLDYLKVLQNKFNEKLATQKGILACWGYYPGHPGVNKITQDTMTVLEKQAGVTFSRSEKKKDIQVGKKATAIYKEAKVAIPTFVEALNDFNHAQKITSTYLQSKYIGKDGRVHSYFNPIVKTGRTSSSRPNMQNFPRDENIRGIYVSPEGWVLYASDYSQLELCALAQSCYVRFGYSKMREIINSGKDLHIWFGMKIKDLFIDAAMEKIIPEFCAREKREPTPDELKILRDSVEVLPNKIYRQQAKACNFGYPGGLGIKTFIVWAKTTYDQVFTEDQAARLRQLWLEAFPEMEFHLKGVIDKFHVGEFGEQRYIGSTIHGRVRTDCGFCDSLNYEFQGVAADGAKNALWNLFLEDYKIVNFIHDEAIGEFKLDDKTQGKCKRMDKVMVDAMVEFIPDVLIKVEGAMMFRWAKEAESIKDVNGNVVICTNEIMRLYDEADKAGEKLVPKDWQDYLEEREAFNADSTNDVLVPEDWTDSDTLEEEVVEEFAY